MLRRSLAAGLIACAAAAVLATAAADSSWRDVLDTPALKSPLAARAILNGLAKAGPRVVAVGQRGHILYSDDAGKSWQQAEVPVSSDLVAVQFPTAQAGWAVGHDGVILHSTDAGRSWTRQLDGRADGAENPLLDVWFSDANNGVAVGAFGLILRTSDGGAHWEPWSNALDNPKKLHLYAVRGIGADLYIAGEQGLLFKLEPGATHFRTLETPYKGTLFGVTGNERAVLAHGLRGNVVRSTDGGVNWQPVATGVQSGLTGNTVDEQGRFILVSQTGQLLASNDNGASFTVARIERPIPGAAVIAVAKGALAVAGPRGVQPVPLP